MAGAARAVDTDAAPAAPAPAARKTKLETARAKLETINLKLVAAQEAAIGFKAAYAACRLGHPQRDRREMALAAANKKVEAVAADFAVAKRKLEELEQLAAAKAAAAAAKVKEAKDKQEAAKYMTDNGMIALVNIRLGMQHLYDGKANKNDKIWDVVHTKYQAEIDAGTLPRSDERSVASLKAKFSTLQGVFKLYINKVARAKQSGASAKDVGTDGTRASFGTHRCFLCSCVNHAVFSAVRLHADLTSLLVPAACPSSELIEEHKNATTPIFLKFDHQEREAIIPPFTVNGGNVECGGAANPLRKGKRRARAGPEADDDESSDEGSDEADGDEGSGDEGGGGGASTSGGGLHIGGRSDKKYRPAKKKAKIDVVGLLAEWRMADEKREEERKAEQQQAIKEAREHELKVLKLLMGHTGDVP